MKKQTTLIKGIVLIMALIAFTQCKKELCNEKTIKDCMVTLEANPVCGCNGKTYGNPSMAACDNITEYTMGPCEN